MLTAIRMALLIALALLPAFAFDSEKWLKDRGDDSDMLRLRQAFEDCSKKIESPAENVAFPLETYADGTVKSVDATQFPLVERYGKQELEQAVEALRSDRLVPAIEKHLEKMCSVNENTVFIAAGQEDPEKDYRDYEKGEYTKYEFGQEENEVWIVSSDGKPGRIVFLDVYRKLTPKNGEPLYDCRSECLIIFLA